jgi:hypothetical protein
LLLPTNALGLILLGMLSAEEENWMAQYGQIDRSGTDEGIVKAVDLWDWELVEETSQKGRNCKIARLMGQLVGQSSSMHPSLPSSGGTLKTTAVRQVHLDLVLVASGAVITTRIHAFYHTIVNCDVK